MQYHNNTAGIAGPCFFQCVCVSRSKSGVTETDDCVKVVSPEGIREWFSTLALHISGLGWATLLIVMT